MRNRCCLLHVFSGLHCFVSQDVDLAEVRRKGLESYPQPVKLDNLASTALAHLKAAERILQDLPPEYRDQVWQEVLAEDWKSEQLTWQSYAHQAQARSGAVFVAGGPRGALYIPLVYISAFLLRRFGCTWPIEVWHFDYDLSKWHQHLFASVGVRLRNLREVLQKEKLKSPWTWDTMRGFGAWRKLPVFAVPFAVEQTDFDVVAILNADFIPMINLCDDSVWETPDGLHGPPPSALVFPDHFNLSATRYFPKQWERLGVALPENDLPESEVGVVYIDKKGCPEGMRLLFDVIQENQEIRAEHGEEIMEEHFYGENSMWRPIWAKAGCHCAVGKFPQAIAGAKLINGHFMGTGKISRGFKDGRMLGLHFQWGKSMILFSEPQSAFSPDPFLNRVQIGVGFADSAWWDMLSGAATAEYLGWATGEWSVSFGCERPEVPCEERTLFEWFPISHDFRRAWAEAFAV